LAVENGNLENMKWLLDNGYEFTGRDFRWAIQNGNKENIEWLKENGCPH